VGGRLDGWGPPSGEVRGREWSGPGWGEGGLAVQFGLWEKKKKGEREGKRRAC